MANGWPKGPPVRLAASVATASNVGGDAVGDVVVVVAAGREKAQLLPTAASLVAAVERTPRRRLEPRVVIEARARSRTVETNTTIIIMIIRTSTASPEADIGSLVSHASRLSRGGHRSPRTRARVSRVSARRANRSNRPKARTNMTRLASHGRRGSRRHRESHRRLENLRRLVNLSGPESRRRLVSLHLGNPRHLAKTHPGSRPRRRNHRHHVNLASRLRLVSPRPISPSPGTAHPRRIRSQPVRRSRS